MIGPDAQDSFTGQYDATAVTVTICSALSLYNALELMLLIVTTFKEWHSFYFWSLLVASFGVIPYTLGFAIEYFNLSYPWLGQSMDSVGWILMITGQSFVLYSRLGLILDDRRILLLVKWMIIIDAVIFHVTTTVLMFGSHYGDQQYAFGMGYLVMEKIQMTGFCIQEFIISGLYVWKTIDLLKVVSKKGTRRVMWQLFIINVIIIFLDVGLLAIEYKDLHIMEQTVKSFIYSVKLKLEFAILGKLVDLVKSSQQRMSSALANVESAIDQTQTHSILTKITSRASNPQWVAQLESGTAEHIEHASSPRTMSSNNQSERDQEAAVRGSSIETRWRNRRDSTRLYAEAMRTMSND